MTRARNYRNCASLFALAVGMVSFAQTARAEIETVTVTAERRNVDLQKTTLAATVLTADDLSKKSVLGLTSLQYAAPGIQISDYGSANVFNMRGVGREAVDVEIPSGVAIYRDGVPTLAGYFQNEPYYDLDGVEVLRGPQGTLAGQSASGGALFIRTKNPQLGGFSGNIQAGAGEWGEFEAEGAVNIPLGDTAAIRISANHVNRNRWYHLSGTFTGDPATRELDSVRFGIYWQPNSSWEFLAKTDVGDLDFGGNPVSTPGTDLFTIQLDDPMKYEDKSIRQVVDIKYHFADGTTLRSLSGLQTVHTENDLDADGPGPAPSLLIANGGTINPTALNPTGHAGFFSQGNFYFYSEELDLVSPENQRFRWVLGAFAERQVSRIPDWFDHGVEGFTFHGFFGVDTTFPVLTTPWIAHENDLAVFANTEYDLTDQLTLEAGLRASYNQKHSFTDVLLGFGNTPPFIPLELPGDVGHVGKTVGDYLDGKVALQWKPTEDDFVYAEGARGHTVKGVNIFPNGGVHDPYSPMEVWNYEVGWKTTTLDDHMRVQLDGYYETIGNYQAVFGTFTGGLINGSETRNAETRSKIWGLEASGQGQWDDFGLDFGIAYLNSKLGTYTNIINPFGTPPSALGLGDELAHAEAVAFGDAACQTGTDTVTLTGSKAPFSPDVTANVGAQYKIHTGMGVNVTPRADVAYFSDQHADLFKCSLETMKSRTLLNLQLRVDSDDSPWWGSIWATNVTDEKYVAAVQNIPPIIYAGPRRQIGIRIGTDF